MLRHRSAGLDGQEHEALPGLAARTSTPATITVTALALVRAMHAHPGPADSAGSRR
ncbi:hypothetical protein [Streptomyces sp. NPDC088727]|uniref:hypothetical protein n=1 Tax=Streptomyces sp. NPDC088727 TaxID=3365875 RepID=UPI0037F434CE